MIFGGPLRKMKNNVFFAWTPPKKCIHIFLIYSWLKRAKEWKSTPWLSPPPGWNSKHRGCIGSSVFIFAQIWGRDVQLTKKFTNPWRNLSPPPPNGFCPPPPIVGGIIINTDREYNELGSRTPKQVWRQLPAPVRKCSLARITTAVDQPSTPPPKKNKQTNKTTTWF